MKVLIHSNACFAPSGYGTQTAQLATRLKSSGHDVAVSAFYGVRGSTIFWNGILHYPADRDIYGNDVILPHARHHFQGDLKSGLVITLVDAWVLKPEIMLQTNWAGWVPVDHNPIPPAVLNTLRQGQSIPIAMSKFGYDLLDQAGTNPIYCPHSIDTSVFRPLDRSEIRRKLEIPDDAFVVGIIGANTGVPSRKNLPKAIDAFAIFRESHPEAILYLHTDLAGRYNGVDLQAKLANRGIPPANVRFTNQYEYFLGLPPERLAEIYNALDVLLHPSLGEGFGIVQVEAQACGVPIITTDWTSMTELCGAGWRVSGDLEWSSQSSYWMNPSLDGLVFALAESFETRGTLGEKARAFALQYDTDRVFQEFWVPALVEIENRQTSLFAELIA